MGFPSPATDYIEKRFDLNDHCDVRPNTQLFECDGALYVFHRSVMPKAGQPFVFELNGKCDVGKFMGSSLITMDGESVEGSTLEDVIVFGVVTHTITPQYDERP